MDEQSRGAEPTHAKDRARLARSAEKWSDRWRRQDSAGTVRCEIETGPGVESDARDFIVRQSDIHAFTDNGKLIVLVADREGAVDSGVLRVGRRVRRLLEEAGFDVEHMDLYPARRLLGTDRVWWTPEIDLSRRPKRGERKALLADMPQVPITLRGHQEAPQAPPGYVYGAGGLGVWLASLPAAAHYAAAASLAAYLLGASAIDVAGAVVAVSALAGVGTVLAAYHWMRAGIRAASTYFTLTALPLLAFLVSDAQIDSQAKADFADWARLLAVVVAYSGVVLATFYVVRVVGGQRSAGLAAGAIGLLGAAGGLGAIPFSAGMAFLSGVGYQHSDVPGLALRLLPVVVGHVAGGALMTLIIGVWIVTIRQHFSTLSLALVAPLLTMLALGPPAVQAAIDLHAAGESVAHNDLSRSASAATRVCVRESPSSNWRGPYIQIGDPGERSILLGPTRSRQRTDTKLSLVTQPRPIQVTPSADGRACPKTPGGARP